MNLTETLIELIQKIDQQTTQGHTKYIQKPISATLQMVKADPLILWNDKENAALLAKILMLALVYDVSEDEDELIRAAHLSYFYALRVHELSPEADQLFAINKNLIVLLGHYSDYLYQTIAMCYRGQNQELDQESFTESLHIGQKRIHLLELKFLNEIEQLFADYNNDDFLIERENEVVQVFDFSEENLEEAELLSKVLFGYIAKKIQLNDLEF